MTPESTLFAAVDRRIAVNNDAPPADKVEQFNAAASVRAAELQAGGLSEYDALCQAQDEVYERFVDVLK